MMAIDKQYFIYIMTNTHDTVLYTGVTSDLANRVLQHKSGVGGIFTRKYNIHKLVYYEVGNDIYAAVAREKQIKGGSRQKKIDLINRSNPEWKDLFEEIT
jgi:putative endonuclease